MRSLFFFFLFGIALLGVRAQQVFDSELANATAALRHHRAGFVSSRMAQFKVEALMYLKEKSTLYPERCSARWLDVQAYHLADFIDLYFRLLTLPKLRVEEREQLRDMFAEACDHSPAFHDDEEERVHKFIRDSVYQLTPFTLDTDWQTAFLRVESELRSGIYAPLLNPPLATDPRNP